MNQNILITGGTGTFGRAFARYALEAGCQRICIFSRGEHAQALMREEFCATDQDKFRWFIGDVRDQDRLQEAMNGVGLVVHAAALKRVEVGEYSPLEMARTNVDGAINVIQAATRAPVGALGRTVVALSTDKASAPLNAYGASKLMAEKLFMAANHMYGEHGPRFCVTRYGNVAGSQGSVIPIWRRMQDAGAAVRMSDPFATRFWMDLPDAVALVALVAQLGGRGVLAVPNLRSYNVGDLLRAMEITHFTVPGLGNGEKMHETMVSQDEAPEFIAWRDLYLRPFNRMEWADARDTTGSMPATGLNSYHANRLTVDELRVKLKGIP